MHTNMLNANKSSSKTWRREWKARTITFCCNALFTNARCISFFNCSSCFILLFVAIGLGVDIEEAIPSTLIGFFEAIVVLEEAAEDWERFVKPSSDDFVSERVGSKCRWLWGVGPALGGLWLNWERVEWGSMTGKDELGGGRVAEKRKKWVSDYIQNLKLGVSRQYFWRRASEPLRCSKDLDLILTRLFSFFTFQSV